MTTRVITKELAVEQDLRLGKGNVQQNRGGVTLDLQSISISKVITDVSIFANNTTALDPTVSEYVDPTLHSTVLVEGYSLLGDEGGGIFYFDPTLAPASADGGHIFASGVVTALGAWRRFTDDKIINVKHFGAVGDGIVDDTAALLLAVAAVNTRLKAILYFPEGIYNVNVSLDMTAADMVIVRGDGIQNTIINHTGGVGPLFLFDTGAEIDEAAQFVMGMDFTMRTDQTTLTAIDITSTALVTDITRSAYFTRLLFIGLTAADGWKFPLHTKDVRGVTITDSYARHVSPGPNVGTIFFNIDNTLAFVSDDYTSFNNETHFYENDFSSLVPSGGLADGSITTAKLADGAVTIAKLANATAGDIITFDATGAPILLPAGAVGFVLTIDGTGLPAWLALPVSVAGVFSQISGLILSNDTDTAHDINITNGSAIDSTNTSSLTLTSEITKQLDATFAVGDDAGGLFSGTIAASTTYHVFIIEKDSDSSIDIGFDTSVIAANIPVGFTKFRRIGSIITDASANIINFVQLGDDFLLKSPILDVDTGSQSTTAILYVLSVPEDIKVEARMNIFANDATVDVTLYVSSPDVNDEIASVTAAPLGSITTDTDGASSAGKNSHLIFVRTNTLGQIRIRANVSTMDQTKIATLGWKDIRGK